MSIGREGISYIGCGLDIYVVEPAVAEADRFFSKGNLGCPRSGGGDDLRKGLARNRKREPNDYMKLSLDDDDVVGHIVQVYHLIVVVVEQEDDKKVVILML